MCECLGVDMETLLHIGLPIGFPMQQSSHISQQLESSDQQVFNQQLQKHQDQRINFEYLLTDSKIYAPAPVELYEQRRLVHNTQHVHNPMSLQPQADPQPIYHQNP